MKIAIRADSSLLIGTGHVMRTFALADELRTRHCEVRFYCHELQGNLISLLRTNGYQVVALPASQSNTLDDAQEMAEALREGAYLPDWMVVDHYEIDWEWEHALRSKVAKILVIDDLPDRIHDCDLLINQNHHALDTNFDHQLVPSNTQVLVGTKYALLRPEFHRWRSLSSVRYQLRRILVSFGGSDPAGATLTTVEALVQLQTPVDIDVVVGQTNPKLKEIQKFCEQFFTLTLHSQTNQMAELMSKSDLAIGAAGTTAWERCCVGLPCVLLTIADNQISIAESIASQKAGWYLGDANVVTSTKIAQIVQRLAANPQEIRDYSKQAFELVDGDGVRRVADIMLLQKDSTRNSG